MIFAALFVLSGFAGLVYEVVFARTLALSFGSTAAASTSVLATYMGGMALGAWLGGRVAGRGRSPLRLYALAEFGIGAWCALSPWLLAQVHAGFVLLARGVDPGSAALAPLRIAASALFLMPPTLLMGMTLPFLAGALRERAAGLGRAAGLLYAANTLGGAAGALASAYALLPTLGVRGSLALAVAANLVAAGAALVLARRGFGAVPAGGDATAAGEERPRSATAPDPGAAGIGLLLLGLGGILSFALEVVYVHLLSVVAGNTTFAFALMLAAFLLGLALGAGVARVALRRLAGRAPFLHLALGELALGLSVVLGAELWERIPDLFLALASSPLAASFAGRELLRGLVCSAAMLPPAMIVGFLWPLAMELAARGAERGELVRLGRAAGINTLGNILGAFLAAFVLVPALGSRRSLMLVAAAAAALALAPARRLEPRARLAASLAALAVAALAATRPGEFDVARLASGVNVYFARVVPGQVIDHGESLDGGITTVTLATGPGNRPVRTLLSNGKFQGDDAPEGEVRAQYGIALCPLLHTPARRRALVIGLGTGATARVVADAGFERIEIAEISPEIAVMARRHFAGVNGEVLERPGVRLHLADGRNVLLLDREPYDLVSIEVSSIWIAGAASLYNHEFYQLVRARLAPDGVLQQWVQIHRLSEADLVSVVATLRRSFARVWLYFVRSQGVLVACNHDCAPDAPAIDALERRAELEPVRALWEGSAAALLGTRLLAPEGVDRYLADTRRRGLDPDALISTDDNLLLEHSTPRANLRGYEKSLRENLERFLAYRPDSPLAGTKLREEQFVREP